jgi:hypothetical protein
MSKWLLLAGLAGALLLPAAGGAAPNPETTITAGPSALVNTTSATFSFTSSDPKARFACSLDTEAFAKCASPATRTVGEGQHHFYVVAVDGNTTDPTPAVWTWTVDTTAPARVKAHLSVGYGRFTLRWGSVETLGADTITLYRSTRKKQPPTREIYRGHGGAYVDTSFRNGGYHRYRVIPIDAAGNVGRAVDYVVGPDALLITPKEGARTAIPLHVRWRAVPEATFYNAQLYRNGRKILSTWPRMARMTVHRSWTYKGRQHRLEPGRYTLFVWPGFGPLALGRYGRLLAQSSFSVG